MKRRLILAATAVAIVAVIAMTVGPLDMGKTFSMALVLGAALALVDWRWAGANA